MKTRNPEGIAEAIRKAETVAVCSHIYPDGDTVGSALAMRLALQAMGKKVQVFCQHKVPDNLAFLPGAAEFRRPEENTDSFDLLLAVDVSDEGRLGTCIELKKRCAHTAQIDHHGTNPGYAEVNSIDGAASATCTMLRDHLKALGTELTADIAVCLYTGISTDTGNFSFDCTDAEAFDVMSDLMKTGLPIAQLSLRLFRERSKEQILLLGKAIGSLEFRADGRLAVMKLTKKDFEDCGALSEHADTLVNYGLETTGTQMALLGRESDDGKIKFSLRAREPYCVDGIAKRLGGGGHARASGISMEGSLEETTETVAAEMLKGLN